MSYWESSCLINCYEDAVHLFSRARCKRRGKPLNSSGAFRLLWNEKSDEYLIFVGGIELGRLTPDDVFTFTCNQFSFISNSVVMCLQDILPCAVIRHDASGEYQIDSHKNLAEANPKAHGRYYWGDRYGNAIAFKSGLQYNIRTQTFLNPTASKNQLVRNPIAEASARWRKSVKKTRGKLKTVLKLLGSSTTLDYLRLPDSAPQVPPFTRTLKWEPDNDPDHRDWMEIFYSALVTQEVDDCFLFMCRVAAYRKQNTTPDDLLNGFERIIDTNRYELRKRFGVFPA